MGIERDVGNGDGRDVTPRVRRSVHVDQGVGEHDGGVQPPALEPRKSMISEGPGFVPSAEELEGEMRRGTKGTKGRQGENGG